MIVFAYIWIGLLLFTTVFFLVAGLIEKNYHESHPVKKWWRKHVVGIDPDEIDYDR